jgi:hypothetical protein
LVAVDIIRPVHFKFGISRCTDGQMSATFPPLFVSASRPGMFSLISSAFFYALWDATSPDVLPESRRKSPE